MTRTPIRTSAHARLAALRAALRGDRGSMSAAVVIWAPLVLLLCAFVVDIGSLISDRSHASDLAEQAARRVADDLDQAVLHEGNGEQLVDLDADGTCRTAARQYFQDNGAIGGGGPAMTGVADVDLSTLTCTVEDNPTPQNPDSRATVTVTIRMKYHPVFLGALLSGDPTVVGRGTASPRQNRDAQNPP